MILHPHTIYILYFVLHILNMYDCCFKKIINLKIITIKNLTHLLYLYSIICIIIKSEKNF